MTKNNAWLSSGDPVTIYIYDANEAIELFGEDALEDDYGNGVSIPESLLERYKKNHKEFWDIQAELKRYRK
jgi:hypothetical protein